MKSKFTGKAMNDYVGLSSSLRFSVDKQLKYLLKDLHYPSLHAKKYDEKRDIWQLRVTRDYRLYFIIDGSEYVVLSIKKHPK